VLGIPAERVASASEAHIHVPAGAIPKDGPSAGIAIALALVSEMSNRKVRRDVSMTGEITLRGRVLPIGGVKEKVLGAYRAGIREIIIPKSNEADLEDVPDEVREQLKFHPVETLREVLAIALVDSGRHSDAAIEELIGV
jgi:ATP-dependent Lon protease